MRVFAVLVALSACSLHPAASPVRTAPPSVPVEFPHGIASADGRWGFMETPQGGIRALDLQGGSIIWTKPDARVPLLVDDGRLLAAAAVAERPNAVRLVLLDVGTGARTFVSDPVVLPAWAIVFGAADVIVRFRAAVETASVVVDWCARSWYGGGAPPPEPIERAARRLEQGSSRIDLATGRVSAGPPPESAVSCESEAKPPKAPVPPGATSAAVVGDRVYYLLPAPPPPERRDLAQAKLVAADVSTGRVIWQHVVEVRAPIRKLPLEIREWERF